MQKRNEPSFLRTKTTGLAHGLHDGCITPWSCIFLNCSATSSLTAKGVRRTGCLFGVASPVSIDIWTRSVSPLSPSSTAKAVWCSNSICNNWSLSCHLSAGPISASISASLCLRAALLISDITVITPTESSLSVVSVSLSAGVSIQMASQARPIQEPFSSFCVYPVGLARRTRAHPISDTTTKLSPNCTPSPSDSLNRRVGSITTGPARVWFSTCTVAMIICCGGRRTE